MVVHGYYQCDLYKYNICLHILWKWYTFDHNVYMITQYFFSFWYLVTVQLRLRLKPSPFADCWRHIQSINTAVTAYISIKQLLLFSIALLA